MCVFLASSFLARCVYEYHIRMVTVPGCCFPFFEMRKTKYYIVYTDNDNDDDNDNEDAKMFTCLR